MANEFPTPSDQERYRYLKLKSQMSAGSSISSETPQLIEEMHKDVGAWDRVVVKNLFSQLGRVSLSFFVGISILNSLSGSL